MKFTFDVSKCDKIFDELMSIGKIILSHTIPPIEDFQKHAYCRWHNYHSHATNDCNVLRRQIQLAINEGQLCLKQMQVNNDLFPINAIDLQAAKVLVPPEQAESTKVKNVIMDKQMSKSCEDNIWSRELVLEKVADGKNVLKIRVKASGFGRGASWQVKTKLKIYSAKHIEPTDQTGRANRLDRSNYGEPTKPKNPMVDEWKVVNAKAKGKNKNFKPTFDYNLSNYGNQKIESRDRSSTTGKGKIYNGRNNL
jgi:hypothetical protein